MEAPHMHRTPGPHYLEVYSLRNTVHTHSKSASMSAITVAPTDCRTPILPAKKDHGHTSPERERVRDENANLHMPPGINASHPTRLCLCQRKPACAKP
jgi:hypothetical protein